MTSLPSRRTFLQSAAAAAAGVTIVPRHVLGGTGYQAPSDTFNVAGVGVGGMGRSNLTALASQNIVALCDVDFGYVDRKYADLPTQLEQARKQIAELKANPNAPPPAQGPGRAMTPAARLRGRRAARRQRRGPDRQGRQGEALPGLPPDAGGAEGHRRRPRGDARPHARGDRHGGDVARQARLRAEAAVLVGARGPRAGEEGGRDQGRHADGQPGALARRRAQGDRVHPGRLHRRREGGPHLDQPAAFLLAAGPAAPGRDAGRGQVVDARHRQAPGQRDGRQLRRAAGHGVGPVPRPGARGAVSPGLPPGPVARLGRLGPGRAGRHGRAPGRSPVLGARARHADHDRDRVDAVQRRVLPDGDDDALSVRRARQQAAGEADVVRRRLQAAAPGGARRNAARRGRRRALHRQQGQADARHLRRQPAPAAAVAARQRRHAEADAAAHRDQPRDELGRGGEGQDAGVVARSSTRPG